MSSWLQRDNPSRLVEKTVDPTPCPLPAQEHPRLADLIRQTAYCSDHWRRRLGIVQIEKERRRCIDEQHAVVIPDRDRQNRDTLANCSPSRWRDGFRAITVLSHVSKVA